VSDSRHADSARPDTRVDLAGIKLRNPVLTASGTFGYGSEFAPFLDLRRIGGFVAKSLTLEPRFGNPPPRISEAPSAMLNAISLENVGVDAFIAEKLPAIPDGVTVIASLFETDIAGYAAVAERLSEAPRIAGLEVNASCPHVKSGGIEFGQNPVVLAELVRTVRRATSRPLLVKLSPNVVGTCNPADRASYGLAGFAGSYAPDLRNRRDRDGGRRDQVPALRGHCGPGRYGELPRPDSGGRNRRRHRGLPEAPRDRASFRPGRGVGNPPRPSILIAFQQEFG